MGTPKVTGMFIGIILISLFSGMFSYVVSSYGDKYYSPATSDLNNSMAIYAEHLDSIVLESEKIKNEVEDVAIDPNFFDVLGAMFGSAYKALKVTGDSFLIFQKMVNQMFIDLGIAGVGYIIKTALITIFIVMLFIGIFIKILVKSGEI